MKVKINNYDFKFNNKKDINIKLISDIHYDMSFNIEKLNVIEQELNKTKTDYIFIAGDIIDSTNILNDNNKKQTLYNWFKRLNKEYKVFISLGNHDISKLVKRKWIKDNNNFWKDLDLLENIYVSKYNYKYEDENIIVILNQPKFEYYYNKFDREDKNELKNMLNKKRKSLTNLSEDKIKIFLNHSPIHIDNNIVSNYLCEFNLILCGHMHRGMMPLFLDKILKNNIGLLSPNKRLFPNNARGLKKYSQGKYLLISGGITKVAEHYKLLKFLNKLYPMEIENIIIKKRKN